MQRTKATINCQRTEVVLPSLLVIGDVLFFDGWFGVKRERGFVDLALLTKISTYPIGFYKMN